jgi:hypothetical protein
MFTNVLSTNIVNSNILGDEAITIKINGGCIIVGNSTDNFGSELESEAHEPSNVIFMKPVDIPSNGQIKYDIKNSGDSFHYRFSVCRANNMVYFICS